MGPTWLVLLLGGNAALILHRGKDEVAAIAAFEAERESRMRVGSTGSVSVILTAIRAEVVLA